MILSLGLARNPRLKIVLHGERRVCNRYAEDRGTSLGHFNTWIYNKCWCSFFFFGHAMQYARSSPTRDQTHAPCIGNAES